MEIKQKLKDSFKSIRVIVLIVFVILALWAIQPNFWKEGVAIRSVEKDSAASLAGMQNPNPKSTMMSKEVISLMNNVPIKTEKDYYDFISTQLEVNKTVQIKTNKDFYTLTVKPKYEIIETNKTEKKQFTELINESIPIKNEQEIGKEYYNKNGTLLGRIIKNVTGNYLVVQKEKTIEKIVPVVIQKFVGPKDLGLAIYQAPTTNIRKGLDLTGGTRVLLQPERKITPDEIDIILSNLKERLNVYGLADVVVRETKDLPPPLGKGNQYIAVEIAGVKQEEVKDLISKQGKFEAKIGNDSVFRGGTDIRYVCRTAECSGIDPQRGCGTVSGGYACGFRFSIALSQESAQRQADITKDLDVIGGGGDEQYLSKKIDLFLDDTLVDSLNIGVSLKGKPSTDIQISGSGSGVTQQDAVTDALASMKKLQTVLITGSLPIKLNIVKTDEISPVLGKEFINNALLIGLLSMLAVAAVIVIRYKEIKVSIPIVITMVSEVVIMLGFAALIRWNIDLAAIAGIIVAVGTGVDDQIIITDETLRGHDEAKAHNWKERMSRAFFIIMGSYFTVVVSMIPLFFAGAGLLKGFAITTILGVSIGVFITRPAYAAVIEVLLKK